MLIGFAGNRSFLRNGVYSVLGFCPLCLRWHFRLLRFHQLYRLLSAVKHKKFKPDCRGYHAAFDQTEYGLVVVENVERILPDDLDGDSQIGGQLGNGVKSKADAAQLFELYAHVLADGVQFVQTPRTQGKLLFNLKLLCDSLAEACMELV